MAMRTIILPSSMISMTGKRDALENINKAIGYLKKDKDWISYAYRLRANINLQLSHEDLALDDWKASLKRIPMTGKRLVTVQTIIITKTIRFV